MHLLSRGLKARSINPIVGALRFIYGTTLGNKALVDRIGYARPEDTLPEVPTQDQDRPAHVAAGRMRIVETFERGQMPRTHVPARGTIRRDRYQPKITQLSRTTTSCSTGDAVCELVP